MDSDCPGCDVAEPCFCPSLCLWPWVSHLGIRGHLYEARMRCQALFHVSLCVCDLIYPLQPSQELDGIVTLFYVPHTPWRFSFPICEERRAPLTQPLGIK